MRENSEQKVLVPIKTQKRCPPGRSPEGNGLVMMSGSGRPAPLAVVLDDRLDGRRQGGHGIGKPDDRIPHSVEARQRRRLETVRRG